MRTPEGTEELFEEVLPNVTSKSTRARIQRHLYLPGDRPEYWEDTEDDIDEDEEDNADEDEEGFVGEV